MVAGRRRKIEEAFQAAKAGLGLDQHQNRRWTSWHRWTTLAILAHAFLAAATAHHEDNPVESLGPRSIVAGHQNSKLDDDAARTIAETREYLDVAEELLSAEKNAVDFFNAMVDRYPDPLGRTVLWATARAVYGIREHPAEDPIQFIAGGWL